ncbi:DUF411 domain-containing protein [Aestuariivirga sp.]|uniref:DUF411 domain-containing protein n=1 Tax=Aestuariivirga sp. TaxID=2650926 RepID=UPI0035943CB6
MKNFGMNRRTSICSLIAIAAGGLFPTVGRAAGDALPPVRAYRNPGCGCCEKWAGLMKEAGFAITMEDDNDLAGRKEKLGVPAELSGCHTALIAGYVIEGHVPPKDILRLLAEKPDALGLAVPGMPVGSPGMEAAEEADAYDVIQFARNGSQRVFARYT